MGVSEDLARIRRTRHTVKPAGSDPSATNGRAVPVARKKPGRPPQENPFAQIPLHWLPIIQRARADRALPLLVAIAYQMRMSRKPRVAVTSQTWRLAGDPRTEAQRRAMINVLRRIPSIVRLEFSQHTGPKYAAIKGRWWDTAPSPATKAEEKDEIGEW
jgi:hypothetical protein